MKLSNFKYLLSVAALTVSFLGISVPAQAQMEKAVADPGCAMNKVCVWEHRDFKGITESRNFRTPYIGSRMNDKITSYRIGKSNTRYQYVMFYDHAYNPKSSTGSGPSFYDKAGKGHQNVSRLSYPGGGNWDNKISAFDEAN